MTRFNPASTLARSVLEQAIAVGVQHLVLCPGSRSQALALEAARLEAEGRIRLHVRTDERSAGFLALGIGLQTGVPAPVITTSGSAVANLLPAVLEAHHSGVPMLLLTADRPAELRGRRSNQTTRQDLMLAPFLRALVDAPVPEIDRHGGLKPSGLPGVVELLLAAQGLDEAAHPGPVQLNLQFAEPLSGPVKGASFSVFTIGTPALAAEPLRLSAGPRTVVVAGARAGEAAEAFAREALAPLFAEVVSGSHFGPQLVVAYRQLLALPEYFNSVERVVVFGTPTLSREIPKLLARDDLEVIVVDSPGVDAYRPQGAVVTAAAAVRATGEPTPELVAWGDIWMRASRKLIADQQAEREFPASARSGVALGGHVEDFAAQRDYVNAELAAVRAPVTRERLVDAVWRASWPYDRLLFGASRLVRVADATLPGKKLPVFANRGQAGIDGTIATGMGLALAAEGGTTRVLLGDLAALHDAGSMRLTPDEPLPALQLIVGNDHGGTIFTDLEVGKSADAAAFERVMLTPQQVDFAALSAAYGWRYVLADTVGALDQALTSAPDGPVLIEVPLDR